MSQPSLLSFLDAPVVVGDPDGRAAYVNPAFEAGGRAVDQLRDWAQDLSDVLSGRRPAQSHEG